MKTATRNRFAQRASSFLQLMQILSLLTGCNLEADFGQAIETQTLAAEDYQQEIVTIDRLIFSEELLGQESVRRLEAELAALSQRVESVSAESKFLKLEALELLALSKAAGRLSSGETGNAIANDWMRIRNNLFDDRHWFARSAADLGHAATFVETSEPVTEKVAAITEPERGAEQLGVHTPLSHLTGSWQVHSILANGEPQMDEELDGSVWSFEQPRLVLRGRDGSETLFQYRPDADARYLSVTKPDGTEGWILHELSDSRLRIAFHDGLGGKPSGFEANESRPDPMLLVLSLRPVR